MHENGCAFQRTKLTKNARIIRRSETIVKHPRKVVNNSYKARLERLKEELNRPSVTEYLERQKHLFEATEQSVKPASNRLDEGKGYAPYQSYCDFH